MNDHAGRDDLPACGREMGNNLENNEFSVGVALIALGGFTVCNTVFDHQR